MYSSSSYHPGKYFGAAPSSGARIARAAPSKRRSSSFLRAYSPQTRGLTSSLRVETTTFSAANKKAGVNVRAAAVPDKELLRKEEISRIVKRVASHCTEKLRNVLKENKELKERVKALEEASRKSKTTGEPVCSTYNGIEALRSEEQIRTEVIFLRKALLAEKRQRLLVEEQTQKLTEQHHRLVGALEHRLRKQESQIRRIVHAAEDGKSASPTPSNVSSPRKEYTPRYLFDHHLPQQIQTQEGVGKLRNLLVEDCAPECRTLYGGASSQEQEPLSSFSSDEKPSKGSAAIHDSNVPDEVEEIASFLEQITKELEVIRGDTM